jgi:hypothetical protein
VLVITTALVVLYARAPSSAGRSTRSAATQRAAKLSGIKAERLAFLTS